MRIRRVYIRELRVGTGVGRGRGSGGGEGREGCQGGKAVNSGHWIVSRRVRARRRCR